MADSKIIGSNNCMQVQIFRRVTTFPRSGKDPNCHPQMGGNCLGWLGTIQKPLRLKPVIHWKQLTSDLGFKVTRIQTCPRYLADAPLTSIWYSYVTSLSSYHIQTWVCMPPAHQGWQQYPNSPLPLRSKNLNQNSLTPEETVLICFKGFNKYQLSQKLPVIPTRRPL